MDMLGSYLPEHLWSQLLSEPSRDFRLEASLPIPSNGTSFLWGDLKCVQNGVPDVFNYSTRYFSHCLVSLFAALFSIALIGPVIYRALDLRHAEAGAPTFRGQVSGILSLVAPVLAMARLHAPIDLATAFFGLFVAGLQVYQDGRVVICCPELLYYWLAMSFVYVSWALDSFLSDRRSFCLLVSAVSSLAVLYLELNNSERHPSYSYSDSDAFSKVSTSFITKAMKSSVDGKLEYDSLPNPPDDIDSRKCYEALRDILAQYPHDVRFRVIRSVFSFLTGDILVSVTFSVLDDVSVIVRPKLLQMMLSSMRDYHDGKEPLFRCYYYSVLFAVFPLFSFSLRMISFLASISGSLKSRVSLMSIIYRKGLSLAPAARKEYDSAKLMNLINVDTNQVFMLTRVMSNFLLAPFVLPVALWQLWDYLGFSIAAAALVYLISIPLTSLMSVHIGKIIPKLRLVSDKRVKTTSNLFRNIKSLKLYAWERPFFERVSQIRIKETSLNRAITVTFAALAALSSALSNYVAVAVFVAFLWFRMGALTPELVFPALLLLDRTSSYIRAWPMSIPQYHRTMNAQNRINDLLIQEEQDHANYWRSSTVNADEPAVRVEHATVSWDGDDKKVPLQDISFEASSGDLICVIGRVGAGKTALLEALGGELSVLNGSISIRGSVSYCSQEPWLQNLSLRENVLFGQEFCEGWYRKVIDACELKEDIEQMPRGDLTEIGERGISLSGGQKARVALARAVYSRSDIVLLDDVLSAVDEHVGAALIRKVLSFDGLLATRTIILATNNVKVLSQSSLVIAIDDKRISELASFGDVVRKGHEQSQTYRLIESFGHPRDLEVDPDTLVHRKELLKPENCLPSLAEVPLNVEAVNLRTKEDDDEEEDTRKEGSALLVFKRYFNYLPWYNFWILVASLVLSSVSSIASTLFLGVLTNQALETLKEAKWYLLVFIGLVTMASAMEVLTRIWGDVVIGVQIGRIIHNRMLWNVIHAPMSTFFDVTPIGRLMNRFSGDLDKVDEDVPHAARYLLQLTMSLLATVVTIVVGSPMIAIFMIPLVVFGNNTRKLYIPVRRKASRMASAANSPILSHIEDSIKGQSLLRTFDRVPYFIEVHDLRVDYWIKASFFTRCLGRWLGFHIQLLSIALTLVTAISLSFLTGLSLISVGYAAVMNNFAIRAGRIVGSIINFIAQAEMVSVALERCLEYVDIEKEAPAHIEETLPPPEWPPSGSLHFDHLVARYKPDSPDVLKDLLLNIKSNEKIGVCGRTGSGKSTLALSVFRILEAHKGHIEIDDLNISTLGLSDLRSRLSIIPQDAQVFNGSIRANLDPLEQIDDARLWTVLDLCHLKSRFELQGKTLDTELGDSGVNLSRGESQLLCLGRALLRDSKILVLDEATASVDVETDQIIQETIRKEFANRTIITIAHRLNTIMDSDRVLVLEHGEKREFDTPENLLNQHGLFYSLYTSKK